MTWGHDEMINDKTGKDIKHSFYPKELQTVAEDDSYDTEKEKIDKKRPSHVPCRKQWANSFVKKV